MNDKFLAPGAKVNPALFPDSLHANRDGYQIWPDAMQPLLDEVMK